MGFTVFNPSIGRTRYKEKSMEMRIASSAPAKGYWLFACSVRSGAYARFEQHRLLAAVKVGHNATQATCSHRDDG